MVVGWILTKKVTSLFFVLTAELEGECECVCMCVGSNAYLNRLSGLVTVGVYGQHLDSWGNWRTFSYWDLCLLLRSAWTHCIACQIGHQTDDHAQ